MIVPDWKIKVAQDFGLENVESIADASVMADVWFGPACTLFEKESKGRNVYGRDQGGALAGYPFLVNESNFRVFEWLVFAQGMPSNGVGPSQITFKGHFTTMKGRGLRPWAVFDNMLYGLQLLKSLYDANDHDWFKAATAYNGAESYGQDFVEKLAQWQQRFANANPGSAA